MPLIELELKQANVTENDSSERTNNMSCNWAVKLSEEQSFKKQKRKHSHNDDTTDDQLPSKWSRYNGQGSSYSTLKIIYTASLISIKLLQESQTTASSVKKMKLAEKKQCALKSKLSIHKSLLLKKNNFSDVSSSLKLCCSARISKRDEWLRAAVVTPFNTVKISLWKTVKLTQAVSCQSSIMSQKWKSNSLAAKTAKKGCAKRDDQCNTSRLQGISKKRDWLSLQPSNDWTSKHLFRTSY